MLSITVSWCNNLLDSSNIVTQVGRSRRLKRAMCNTFQNGVISVRMYSMLACARSHLWVVTSSPMRVMSNLHFNGIHNAFKAKLRVVEESQVSEKVESDMSHRHKEAFFSHVGIQRLTKEAVCFINGSALRGPPNKRVSVSKCSRGGCDLMIQKPLVFSQRGCVCLGDSLWRLAFVDERPAVTWLPWHRNYSQSPRWQFYFNYNVTG